MSWNVAGWIPGAPSNDDVPACGRCGHHADAHHDASSCSARGPRWRHCRCTGYTRFDPAAPPTAGPSSPVAR